MYTRTHTHREKIILEDKVKGNWGRGKPRRRWEQYPVTGWRHSESSWHTNTSQEHLRITEICLTEEDKYVLTLEYCKCISSSLPAITNCTCCHQDYDYAAKCIFNKYNWGRLFNNHQQLFINNNHQQIYKSHNIHMYHKLANTLRSMVVHPKDKTHKEHQCGTIYNIMCDIDSSHTYIGETKRTLGQRFKEHTNLDEPTGVGDHCRATGHSVSLIEEHKNIDPWIQLAEEKSEGGHIGETGDLWATGTYETPLLLLIAKQ